MADENKPSGSMRSWLGRPTGVWVLLHAEAEGELSREAALLEDFLRTGPPSWRLATGAGWTHRRLDVAAPNRPPARELKWRQDGPARGVAH